MKTQAMASSLSEGTILSAENLNLTVMGDDQPFEIIHSISMELRRGEIVGFLGPNGCGKTTIIEILAGLQGPTAGKLNWADSNIKKGIVFQNVQKNLVPWMTVEENITLPRIAANSSTEPLERIDLSALLKKVGLDAVRHRQPGRLSGGQQQLVSLARWEAFPPHLLFVDEGWSMLDITQRPRAYRLLQRLAGDRGCAIVAVAHNVSELAEVVHRVVLLTERPARIAAEVRFDRSSTVDQRTTVLWHEVRKTQSASPTA